jgi:hypothetical protein
MSKSKLKHAVRRDGGKNSYIDRLEQRKKAWTRNVYLFTQKETLDAASLTLHELYGFGPERLKRFGEAFMAKFHEIQELNRDDSDDPDREYSRQKFEEAMQEAWGPYYAPREERYAKDFIMQNTKGPVIDQ